MGQHHVNQRRRKEHQRNVSLGDEVDHAGEIGPLHHHRGAPELAHREGDETGGVRNGGDGQIDRRLVEPKAGRPGGDAGRDKAIVGLRQLRAPRGAACGALKTERRVGQAEVQGVIGLVAQPGRKALTMCARRVETDDLSQGRHRGPDLGHHRFG